MRALTRWVLTLFTSPIGVVVLAALDSTLFFNLPLGIDAVVIILAARMGELAWVVPLLATGGSVAGAWLTFWMGTKIGEKSLDRYGPKKRLEKIRARVRRSGAVALAVLDLVPPPFPFTLFVLAAGALEVKPATFFVTLAACRVLRFGLEAVLAVVYGRRILAWLESDLFHDIAAFFIVLAIALSVVSIARIVLSTRPSHKKRVTT
jgi:membrane protein YqaA with SNARE-associated domain